MPCTAMKRWHSLKLSCLLIQQLNFDLQCDKLYWILQSFFTLQSLLEAQQPAMNTNSEGFHFASLGQLTLQLYTVLQSLVHTSSSGQHSFRGLLVVSMSSFKADVKLPLVEGVYPLHRSNKESILSFSLRRSVQQVLIPICYICYMYQTECKTLVTGLYK